MFVKFVQILMVCAIFNPFCCCTAGLLSVGKAENAMDGYSCCQSTQSDLPANTNDDHDPNDCPHKALKEYQATALKDTIATHHASDYAPLLLKVWDFPLSVSSDHEALKGNLTTAAHAPPRPLLQVYCVYRI